MPAACLQHSHKLHLSLLHLHKSEAVPLQPQVPIFPISRIICSCQSISSNGFPAHVGSCNDVLLSTRVACSDGLGGGVGDGFGEADEILGVGLLEDVG